MRLNVTRKNLAVTGAKGKRVLGGAAVRVAARLAEILAIIAGLERFSGIRNPGAIAVIKSTLRPQW